MPAFGPAAAVLIGVFVSNVLYGMFFVLFCGTLYILLRRRSTSGLNLVLLTASILIFVLSTGFHITTSAKTYSGLLGTRNAQDRDLYFLEIDAWRSILQNALLSVNTLVADTVMIYRCWVVWDYRWPIIAFNILLWLFTVATTIIIIVLSTRTSIDNRASLHTLGIWNTIFLAVTLAQNIITTSLVAFRIWRVDAAAAAYKQGSLLPVMWIVIESGGLYVATLFAYLVVSAMGGNGQFTMDLILNGMIGVTFSLIIVRVGLRRRRRRSSSVISTEVESATAHPLDQMGDLTRYETDIAEGSSDEDDGVVEGTRSGGSLDRRKNLGEFENQERP